jgi:hypothetical protein
MNRDSKSLAVQAAAAAVAELEDEAVISAESMAVLIDLAFAAMRRAESERRSIEISIIDTINGIVTENLGARPTPDAV